MGGAIGVVVGSASSGWEGSFSMLSGRALLRARADGGSGVKVAS